MYMVLCAPIIFKSDNNFSVCPTSTISPLFICKFAASIENDIVVNGLSNREHSPRSFLVWNGRHHWAFGYSGKTTLSGLALALAAQPLSKLNITTALNLDGGRSSDLWVSPQVRGGPISTRKSWNNPVRNYLLLHHRPQS